MPAKGQSLVAASFGYLKGLINPGTLGYVPSKRGQLISTQRFRNNYAPMNFREQAATCRMAADHNWFLRPVLSLRAAVHGAGFALVDPPDGGDGVMLDGYDVGALVDDILHEDLVTGNLVALWRKDQDAPPVTIIDAERVEYRSVGGVETLHMSFAADKLMRNSGAQLRYSYQTSLGNRMFQAMCDGKPITIVKGQDKEWNFAVLPGGKRRGRLTVPELVSVLDDIDMIELAKVGDWNLLWKRKDVIRFWTKGYAVKSGGGAGTESVNITKAQIKELGEGAKEINGPVDIPRNHDLSAEYLTIHPDMLEPKHTAGVIERLLHFGGPEAVALFGSFSQQNGAAPSLMRNARARANVARNRAEKFLHMILSEEEFDSLGYASPDQNLRARWSMRPLHSIDELTRIVKETAGGVASPQTRRDLMDLDDAQESQRMRAAAENWQGYVPPFESAQGLVASAYPDIYPDAPKNVPPGSGGEAGRPSAAEES